MVSRISQENYASSDEHVRPRGFFAFARGVLVISKTLALLMNAAYVVAHKGHWAIFATRLWKVAGFQ